MLKYTSTDIHNINVLGKFCGLRDIPQLNSTALQAKYKLQQADVFVLFGGSILYGVDILAQAIKNNIAKKYIVVGGFGHTTATLQQNVIAKYPDIPANKMSEAEIFAALLKKRFNLAPDYLETKSTNCGNNITYLLALLNQQKIDFNSIILSQDATMQRRMSACLKKYLPQDTKIINYATYQVKLKLLSSQINFDQNYLGMWHPKRYQKLLMGEIPRLTDDKNGYGPQGKGFISHVDIPTAVQNAYQQLNQKYPELNRPSDDLSAPQKN